MISRIRPPIESDLPPPLLVLLHGKGANEDDLFALAHLFDPRFTVLSLRAPHEMAPGYYRWYERYDTPQGSVFDEAEIEESRRWLIKTIPESVAHSGADPARVHLLGFSQGAAMALAIALTAPHLVRSVVSIAGRLLHTCTLHAAPCEALQHLSMLLQHGRQDDVVPPSESLVASRLFAEMGVAHDCKEYSAGHTISPAMLKDVLDFLHARLDALGKKNRGPQTPVSSRHDAS